MSPASTRDQVIWNELAVVTLSFVVGMLFVGALQHSMVHDYVNATLLLFIAPMWAFVVVANIRRILRHPGRSGS